MKKQKIWVKPCVKVYTKNDVLGSKTNGPLGENEIDGSKSGS